MSRLLPLLVSVPVFCVLAFLIACGVEDVDWYNRPPSSEMGGGSSFAIHLPTSPLRDCQCTQGPGGRFSHTTPSTRSDLDCDTSNVADEPLYAPVSGIAHVHDVDTGRNFGRHLNIGLPDGTYVVVAHLSKIIVTDGEEVASGQLLGYEGCTGGCTGDHVHVGQHRGDPSRPAEFGTSLGVSYYIADAGASRGWRELPVEDFVCGLRSNGDAQNGLFYRSVATTAMYHPNGTLVRTIGDPKVYRIDNQTLRWIVNEEVFHSYRYSFNEVVFVSEDELACYGRGAPIDTRGMVDAVHDQSGQLWLVVGARESTDRYRIKVNAVGAREVLASWGIDNGLDSPPWVRADHPFLSLYPIRSGAARLRDGTLVRERSRSAVYAVSDGIAMPVNDWDTFLRLGFGRRNILLADDGILTSVLHAVGNCGMPAWCLNSDVIKACGGRLGVGVQTPSPQTPDTGFVDDSSGSLSGSVPPSGTSMAPAQASPPAAPAPPPPPAPGQAPPPAPAQNPSPPPPAPPSPQAAPSPPCDATACIQGNTLLLSDRLWREPAAMGADAHFWGYGDCFANYPTSTYRFRSEGGFYRLDFSGLGGSCTTQFTLISSVGTDGAPPDEHMANWLWYQYEPICRAGTPLCNLVDEGNPWEQWWLMVAYDPLTGLRAAGNGFISRSQL